jgi:hypothetical protein
VFRHQCAAIVGQVVNLDKIAVPSQAGEAPATLAPRRFGCSIATGWNGGFVKEGSPPGAPGGPSS